MADRDDEDEIGILSQWRNGDESAGEALAGRHWSKVLSYIRGKVRGSADVAEDLTQRVFVTVVDRRDDIVTHFSRYLRGVARNVVLEHWRECKKQSPVDVRWSQLASSGHGPLSVLANGEQQRSLVRALRSLSTTEQIYLVWYYGDGLTQPTIAERLGLTVGQINGRLSRAREKLRERFRGQEQDAAETSETGLETWMSSIRHGLDDIDDEE